MDDLIPESEKASGSPVSRAASQMLIVEDDTVFGHP